MSSRNPGVLWTIDPPTQGVISGTGLYTAPGAVPTPPTVKVKATSIADDTISATATATIT